MAMRSSYIKIGWELNKAGLEEANRETDKLISKDREAREAIQHISQSFDSVSSATNHATRQTQEFENHVSSANQQAKNVANTNEKITRTTRETVDAGKGLDDNFRKAEEQASGFSRTAQRATESVTRLGRSGNGISGIGSHIAGLGRGIDGVASKTHNLRDVFMGTFAGSMLSNGISAIGHGLVGAVGTLSETMNENSKAWQTFQGNMAMAGKSASQIKSVQSDLQVFAQKTIYSASDMASTYAQLTSVGVKNTEAVVKGFGGLAATAEEPAQAMKTLSTQATQMAAMPKVQWADLKLMLEQAPAAMGQVAKQMHTNTSGMIKDVQAGTITSKQFLSAIASAGNQKNLQNMATKYKTVGQAMDGFWETTANKAKSSFDSASNVGIKAISAVTDAIGNISSKDISKVVNPVIQKTSDFIMFVIKHGSDFAKIGSATARIFGGVATGAWQAISTAVNILAGKGANASTSIGGIADSMDRISKHQTAFKVIGSGLVTYFAVSKLAKITSGLISISKALGLVNKNASISGAVNNVVNAKAIGKHGVGATPAPILGDTAKVVNASKFATAAVGVGIAADTGIDIYSAVKAKNPETKFKKMGQGLGSAVGGGIGFYFGGPLGAAVGSTIGHVVGGWAGSAAKQFTDGWNEKGRGMKPPAGLLPKAGYYARKSGDMFMGFVKGTINAAKKNKSVLLAGIVSPFLGLGTWFLKDTKLGRSIGSWLSGAVKKGAKVIGNVGQTLAKPFYFVAGLVHRYLVSPMQKVISGLSNWIGKEWRGFSKTVSSLWHSIVAPISKIWSKEISAVRSIWNGFSGWIGKRWSSFSSNASQAWHLTTSVIGKVWSYGMSSLRGVWNGFSGWISDKWSTFSKVAGSVFSAVGDAISKPFVSAWKVISGIFDKIGNKISGVVGSVGDWASGVVKEGKKAVTKHATGTIHASNLYRTNVASGIKTDEHAIVNDGGGRELVVYPNGNAVLPNGRNTHMMLPKGTNIFNASDTRLLMRKQGIHHAGGTTKLKKQSVQGVGGIAVDGFKQSERQTKASMSTISRTVESGYALATKKSNSTINSFNKKSDSSWKDIQGSTKRYTGRIQKNSIGDYDDLQKGSYNQIKQLDRMSGSAWKNIQGDTNKYTDRISKNTVSDFDNMQKRAIVQMNQLHKGMNAVASDMVADFGKIMGKLDNYAHSAMAGAINQLNNGIKGINTVLGKFGGSGSVLPAIHYAEGSRGPIANHQLAVVNDAKSGPTQEAIVKSNGAAYLPRGRNALTPLEPGDEVLNGHDTLALQGAGALPHYAKGTGGKTKDNLKKIIESSNSKPDTAWANEFTKNSNGKQSTFLGNAIANGAQAASNKVGKPWNSEVWSQMSDAMSGGGSAAGGSWAHNPGGWSHTDVFGSPRSGGVHDGNDFSSHQGAVIHAVHGGKVVRAAMPPGDWGPVGFSIITKGDDGQYVMYQEFGTAKNAKVGVGDVVKTGQSIATLGNSGLGTGPHVHIGVSKNYPFHNNGMSTAGWEDLMNMHGRSDGSSKLKDSSKKTKNPALTKLVKSQIGSQLKWVSKNLSDDIDAGSAGNPGGAGVTRWIPYIKKAADAMHVKLQGNDVARILNTINHESGGNPTVWQHGYTDVNTGRDPARGLLQFIGSTFEHYAVKGHDSRTSGYDQLLALFNDKNWRSDLMWNGGWGPSGGRRFAKGGHPGTGQTVMVGENGPELARFEQPATVYSNQASGHVREAGKGNGGKRNVNINLNVKVDAKTGDGKEIGKSASAEITDTLRNLFVNELDNIQF